MFEMRALHVSYGLIPRCRVRLFSGDNRAFQRDTIQDLGVAALALSIKKRTPKTWRSTGMPVGELIGSKPGYPTMDNVDAEGRGSA